MHDRQVNHSPGSVLTFAEKSCIECKRRFHARYRNGNIQAINRPQTGLRPGHMRRFSIIWSGGGIGRHKAMIMSEDKPVYNGVDCIRWQNQVLRLLRAGSNPARSTDKGGNMFKKRSKKKNLVFKPTREQINIAMEEYFARGGEIHKIGYVEQISSTWEDYTEYASDADVYLLGE